ncbi:MAG TPA: CRTAC1 family protein [Vicinamibacteria bacterium]|nr:CRTAC1 family protein [Vicinamibacteria bacterium]
MRLGGLALAVLCALAAAAARPPSVPAPPLPAFTDVTEAAGIRFRLTNGSPQKNYIFEAKGGGVCLLDYDGDGRLDIFFVNGSTLEDVQQGVVHPNALYRANGDGTYADVTQQAGVAGGGWGMGCTVGDYDNDGRPDLYVTGVNGNTLYHNDGNGRFTDVTDRAGLRGGRWSTSAAFVDYDRDGRLDLYVANNIEVDVRRSPLSFPGPDCNYRGTRVMCGPTGLPGALDTLYHNEGDGTFRDVTVAAGVLEKVPRYGLGVAVGDYDNDGWPDIYVANDSTPSYLYHNERNGTFREVGLMAGVAVSDDGMEQAGMGTDFGDYDNDGWLDLTKSNFSFQTSNLYHNEHDGRFSERAFASGLARASLPLVRWGTKFLDYDDDGWPDVIVATGHVYPYLIQNPQGGEQYEQRRILLRNRGDGTFEDVSERSGPGILERRCSRGLAVGDLDDDGDLDVVIVNMDGTPSVLRNDGGNARHWLELRLRGTKSNRMGLGARVTLRAAGQQQIREVTTAGSIFSGSDSRLHFGLGEATQAEVEIRWPSGTVQTLRNLPADRLLEVDEDRGVL